jgi:L-amino acid N-acyltransferase YncA
MSEAEIRRRMAAQMPPEQMAAQADRVIDTSTSLSETGLSLLAAWRELGLPFPVPQVRPATLDDAEGIVAVLNSVVREGGLTVIDRLTTPAEQRVWLERIGARGQTMLALLGDVIAGCQFADPYAGYTGAMDHVASLGTFVAAPARCLGLGRRLSDATFAWLRTAGYLKAVIAVRADNTLAQAFYARLGFEPCGRLHRQALLNGVFVDELLFELFLTEEEERSDTTPQAVEQAS